MVNSDYKSFETEAVALTGTQNPVKQRSRLRMGSPRKSYFGIPAALQFLHDKANYYYNICSFISM